MIPNALKIEDTLVTNGKQISQMFSDNFPSVFARNNAMQTSVNQEITNSVNSIRNYFIPQSLILEKIHKLSDKAASVDEIPTKLIK